MSSLPRPARVPGLELLGVSCLVLFQELALIRWLPVEVRVLAYFPNLVLIASFLGLGVGSLRTGRRSLLWMWPAALGALVGSAILLGRVAFTAEGVTEHLWLLYEDLGPDAPVVEGVRLPIVAFFVLTAASFVPLGQFLGERLQRFRADGAPLRGYSLDLAGSLAGVVGFAVLSGSGTPPWVWFAVVAALAGVVLHRGPRLAAWAVGVGALVAALTGVTDRADHHSPYYALSLAPVPGLPDVRVRANGALHQVAAEVGREDAAGPAWRAQAVRGYHMPYSLLAAPPERALVLGAGTGNDVAVLLAEGAGSVDAVEIDPMLVELGRRIHPDRPYASERVTVHTTDARTFLQETDERYDLIVFGTLDSMTRLAALSTVRLDNFVYTREALEAAASRLEPDGGMALYFMVGEAFIHDRLMGLLAETFGRMPGVLRGDWSMFNTVYVAGPAFAGHQEWPPDVSEWFFEEKLPTVEVPSDDWPYLYLAERSVSPFYLSLIGMLALVAALSVATAAPGLLRGAVSGRGDWEMFLFGAAFLLLETRFVTAMNLLWGATWITSAVVFGAILATLLVATLITEVRPLSWPVAAGGLLASLAVTWLVEPAALLGVEGPLRVGASVAYVGLPVFFAAVCFALRFERRRDAGHAFGWNLLGAVAGGLLEFAGMALGFATLLLLAAALYLGAFLLRERGAGVGTAAEGAAPA